MPRPTGEETCQMIRGATLVLFRTSGYEGTSIADIAAVAVTKAALYYHVPSKVSLLWSTRTGGATRLVAGETPQTGGRETGGAVRADRLRGARLYRWR